MMYLSIITFIATAVPLAAASGQQRGAWTVGQTVDTTSGSVSGHAASVAGDVSEYLGIPYAQPPVQKLRFMPPLRFVGSGKIEANNFVRWCKS